VGLVPVQVIGAVPAQLIVKLSGKLPLLSTLKTAVYPDELEATVGPVALSGVTLTWYPETSGPTRWAATTDAQSPRKPRIQTDGWVADQRASDMIVFLEGGSVAFIRTQRAAVPRTKPSIDQ
jgi:hypothetical protein